MNLHLALNLLHFLPDLGVLYALGHAPNFFLFLFLFFLNVIGLDWCLSFIN
jgi:hypothetical protein